MSTLSYLEAAAYVDKVANQLRALAFDINAIQAQATSPKTLRGPLVSELQLWWRIECARLFQVRDDLLTYCVPRLREAQAVADGQAASRARY
jgi:hypothetical protein